VLGLGVGGTSLVLVAVFALGLWGPQRNTNAERPALIKSVPALQNNLQLVPSPDPETVSNVLPVSTEKNEGITAAPPAPIAEGESQSMPAPEPEPLPDANVKAPVRPNKLVSENDLRVQLHRAPEVGLKSSSRDKLVEVYKTNYQSNASMGRKPLFEPSILMKHVSSAQELPLRPFPNCQLNPISARTLGVLSRALHAYLDGLAPKDATGKRRDPSHVRSVLRQERRGKPPAWLRAEALPAMTQILMAEDVPLRLILVDMMADIPGKAAGIRLAQRAVYDLSPEVRKAAIEALYQRPAGEARRTLVDAMRYPWATVAEHAADALVELRDREAAPLLVALLDKPDPAAPFETKSGASIRELVRVNHIQNCLLCHVPAVGRDSVTDVDPFAHRPTQTYQVGGYGGPKLPGGSSGVWANKVLIRADVQFLRQDFSISFPTGDNFGSDGGLRFDFLIRTRPLTTEENQLWKNRANPDNTAYPQREAALYALRAITGQDAGQATDDWLLLYPNARGESDGVRIGSALRTGSPEQREQLLARYRDAKEDHITEGLSHAIPHVPTWFREKVRTALVERMSRLPTDELRGYLDDEGELRAAAARACVKKADREMIPDLIGLLADADEKVGELALQTLRRLTGEDFGPPAKCSQDEREAAAVKWQEWYSQKGS